MTTFSAPSRRTWICPPAVYSYGRRPGAVARVASFAGGRQGGRCDAYRPQLGFAPSVRLHRGHLRALGSAHATPPGPVRLWRYHRGSAGGPRVPYRAGDDRRPRGTPPRQSSEAARPGRLAESGGRLRGLGMVQPGRALARPARGRSAGGPGGRCLAGTAATTAATGRATEGVVFRFCFLSVPYWDGERFSNVHDLCRREQTPGPHATAARLPISAPARVDRRRQPTLLYR